MGVRDVKVARAVKRQVCGKVELRACGQAAVSGVAAANTIVYAALSRQSNLVPQLNLCQVHNLRLTGADLERLRRECFTRDLWRCTIET